MSQSMSSLIPMYAVYSLSPIPIPLPAAICNGQKGGLAYLVKKQEWHCMPNYIIGN